MYITAAYSKCVRAYLHKRGSSLLVSMSRAGSKASMSGTSINKVPRLFYIVMYSLSEPRTFIIHYETEL